MRLHHRTSFVASHVLLLSFGAMLMGCSDAPTPTPGPQVPPVSSGGGPASTGGAANPTNTGGSGLGGSATGGAQATGGATGGAQATGGAMGGAQATGGAMGGAGGSAGSSAGSAGAPVPERVGTLIGTYPNAVGSSTTVSSLGPIDNTNEFFRSFGNGRACVSCHRPEDGFSVRPKTLQDLFKKCGLDSDAPPPTLSAEDATACAIFRTNDGSNSPTADVSTAEARQKAYSLLLSKGLIRISMPVPDATKRQFEIVEVKDPFGVATSTTVSVYRRPLPATNLSFASSVMWDLRETTIGFLRAPFTPDVTMVPPVRDQLVRQAINATLGHAEAMAPGLTAEQVEAIVRFETSLYSAQASLTGVGDLASNGARGGAQALLNQPVTPICGNLDVYSNNPMYPQCQQYKFNPNSFTVFEAWAKPQGADSRGTLRASIARGQVLFNTRKTQSPPDPFFDHSGDNKNMTCSTCHASFNTGSSSVPVGFANVVVSSGPSIFNSPNAAVDFVDVTMPTYKLRCNANGMAAFIASMGATGCHDGTEPDLPADEITVNDPGRALITGTWQSVGAFKCPTLRNLSARAPYFHDGSAATLDAVVDHYRKALGFEFTNAEKQDLVNFLSAL